ASITALEDEWLGLAALHDPDPPEILFQRYLDRIGDRDTQVIALYRLARQVLDRPETTRKKRQLVLQMLGQALSAMQSDARLVALTPWLPELVAHVDLHRAIEDYREAFARLLGLHTVSWPARRDAIEGLLVRLASVLLSRKAEASRWTRSVRALFVTFEETLAHGIPGQEESAAADLLPTLTATLERLPAEVANLEHPLGSGLRFSDAESEQIRTLCQAPTEERVRALETFAGTDVPQRMAQALAFLLLREGTEKVLAWIDRCPSGSQRDDLCRRLVVQGWVTGPAAGDLLRRIVDSDLARETSVWIGDTSHGAGDWLPAFATLAAENEVDPSDPVWTPLLRDLWTSEPSTRRQILAEAVCAALSLEAPQTAERALRLWLHAHLSPRDHRRQPGTCDKALGAIRTALALSPSAGAI
ncbi:MAG TPA: hypothetical protein VLQ45_22285, partial [Thermoanaerobaculia bacterium]|nr:hypothetical protein [Thermoanaerobaculia bacterium]